MRIAILGSGRGTHLPALLEAIQQKKLSASIEIVMSNKQDALLLKRAQAFHLPVQFIDASHMSREIFDEKVSHVLMQYQIDLIILMGYMRILSSAFVHTWKNKIINIHPSLLPAFAGKMDLAVHQAVLDSGVKETGCTIHYVTEDVDAGPILLQKKCEVLANDTAETLKARVQELEAEALVEVLQKFF
jgi:phosphoribosylglycinamide formyltransferase 1